MSLKLLYNVTESARVVTESVPETTKTELKELIESCDTSYYKIKRVRRDGADLPSTYTDSWLREIQRAVLVPSFKFTPPKKDDADYNLKQLKGKKKEVYQAFLSIG